MESTGEVGIEHVKWSKKTDEVATPPPEKHFSLTEKPSIMGDSEQLRFQCDGLSVKIGHPKGPIVFSQPGQDLLAITPEMTVGLVDFTPNGLKEYQSGHQSISLASAFRGMGEFLKMYKSDVSQGWEKPKPEFLYGLTNERMAKFASRFGFKMEYKPLLHHYLVFGKFIEVKETYETLVNEKPELIEGLMQRAMREQEE